MGWNLEEEGVSREEKRIRKLTLVRKPRASIVPPRTAVTKCSSASCRRDDSNGNSNIHLLRNNHVQGVIS